MDAAFGTATGFSPTVGNGTRNAGLTAGGPTDNVVAARGAGTRGTDEGSSTVLGNTTGCAGLTAGGPAGDIVAARGTGAGGADEGSSTALGNGTCNAGLTAGGLTDITGITGGLAHNCNTVGAAADAGAEGTAVITRAAESFVTV